MAVIFKGRTKHGRLDLQPGTPLAFKDKRAEEYFVKAGWADKTKKKPVATYPAGSVEIDPETIFADGPDRGRKVLA